MKTNKINKNIQVLNKDEADAITSLIDMKVEGDMEKVISEIKSLRNDMESKFQIMESTMESKFNTIDSKFAILQWGIGLGVALIIATKFI